MVQKNFDTRLALLESGKAEFLARGFEDASLRTICANAKVTTGAFYSHFKCKEDLFVALVEDDLRECEESWEKLADRIAELAAGGVDGEVAAMDFLLTHRDLALMLLDCAAGTSFASFKERLAKQLREQLSKTTETDTAHVLVCMKFAELRELLRGDYASEQAARITRELAWNPSR